VARRASAPGQVQKVIVLDTNVVSAIMRDEPDTGIALWLNRLPEASIWLTTITIFEVRYGIEVLPASRRRRRLELEFGHVLDTEIQGRILSFDENAATVASVIAATRRRRGRPSEIRDTLIAGIVISRRAEFATRNVRHFGDLDIQLIDPWAN
jgi:predicted nucleic acid-binding protein